MKMSIEKCRGCRNNFYNGNNNLGVKRCWSFKDAKLVKKYYIHMNTPMSGYKKAWRSVGLKPDCYYGEHGNNYISKEKYDKLI
jgi:hypothetical protein